MNMAFVYILALINLKGWGGDMDFCDFYSKRRKESEFYRYWSDDEEAFIISNYKIMSAKEIAIHLNRSLSSVKNRIRLLGQVKIRLLSSSDISFIKCNLGKLSCAEIGRRLGFSRTCITKFCKRNNLCFKVFGDNHHNTLHSDEDFLLINALYDEGVSLSEIVPKFDIPYATVKSYLFKDQRRISSDYYLFVD